MVRMIFAVLTVVVFSANGFAFGIPKLPGTGSKSAPAVNIEDALSMQNDLMKAYTNGVKYNLEANSIMGDALNLKEEAANLKADAQGVDGTNVKDLKARVAKTKNATLKIENAMASNKELSSEAKKKVAKSFIPLAASLVSYKVAADKSVSALENAKSVIENAPMTEKLSAKSKLDPILTIAPSVPGDLADVLSMTNNYVKFAKSNGIEVPKDLSAALGD
jgi:hypothetical protein